MEKITRRLSNEFATFLVETEDGIIIKGAPIVRRFVGQEFMDLMNWMGKVGGPTTITILEQKDE